jgi:hypothetical protein
MRAFRRRKADRAFNMSQTITAIGVYRAEVTDHHIEVAAIGFAPRTAKDHIRRYLEGFVLVDFLVQNASPDFDLYGIKQTTAFSRSYFDTTFLSVDASRALVATGNDLPTGIETLRVVIYLHNYQEQLPLLTPYGQVVAPRVGKMPKGMMDLTVFPCGD